MGLWKVPEPLWHLHAQRGCFAVSIKSHKAIVWLSAHRAIISHSWGEERAVNGLSQHLFLLTVISAGTPPRTSDFRLTLSSEYGKPCVEEMSVCPRSSSLGRLLNKYLYSWFKVIDLHLFFAILPLPYRLLWSQPVKRRIRENTEAQYTLILFRKETLVPVNSHDFPDNIFW